MFFHNISWIAATNYWLSWLNLHRIRSMPKLSYSVMYTSSFRNYVHVVSWRYWEWVARCNCMVDCCGRGGVIFMYFVFFCNMFTIGFSSCFTSHINSWTLYETVQQHFCLIWRHPVCKPGWFAMYGLPSQMPRRVPITYVQMYICTVIMDSYVCVFLRSHVCIPMTVVRWYPFGWLLWLDQEQP